MASKKQVPEGWQFPNVDPNEVVTETIAEGGHTVNLLTGVQPKTGTAVSIPGHEQRIPMESFSAEEIARYINTPEHFEAATARPARHLGTWVDADEAGNKVAFADVSRVHKSTPEGNRRARLAMMANNQFAGFNFDEFVTEYNPLQQAVLNRAGGKPKLMEGEGERWVTSKEPIGQEVVYAETTEPQVISRGRGKKKKTIPAGQGTFIFTGKGSQLQG